MAGTKAGDVSDGFAGNVDKELEARWGKVTEGASGRAKDMLLKGYLQMGEGIYKHSVRLEASSKLLQTSSYMTGAVGDTLETAGMTGNFTGARDQLDRIFGKAQGILPQAEIDVQKGIALKTLDSTETNHIATNQGPEAAAKALENGTVGTTLNPEQKTAKVEEFKRQAVINQAASRTAATEAAKDALGSVTMGDPEAPKKTAQAKALVVAAARTPKMKAKAAAEFDEKVNQAQTANVLREGILSTPVPKQEEKLQEIQAQFGAKSPVATIAEKMVKEFQSQAKNDPAAYALNDSGLQREWSQARKSNDPGQFQAALEKLTAAQELAGLDPRVMTVQEATGRADMIHAMLEGRPIPQPEGGMKRFGPAEASLAIQALPGQYGRFGDKAFRDLQTLPPEGKGVPMAARYIAALPAGDHRAVSLAEGLSRFDENGKSIKVSTKDTDFQKSIQANETFQAFRQLNAATAEAEVRGHEMMVAQQADWLLFSGKATDENDAVSKAVNQTIGSMWSFRDGLQIPKTKQDGTPRTDQENVDLVTGLKLLKTQVLDQTGLVDSTAFEAKFDAVQDPKERAELARKSMKSVAGWVTSEDGQGATLYAGTYENGRFSPMAPIRGKDKQPLTVDWDRATQYRRAIAGQGSATAEGIVPEFIRRTPAVQPLTRPDYSTFANVDQQGVE
jgi:hypothetical protein